MWKIITLLAALYVCSLASEPATIIWSCMTHINVTSSKDPNKYYEEYRMVTGGKTVYSLEYVYNNDNFYYGLAVFNASGDCTHADVYTNQTGECEYIPGYEMYEQYISSFKYNGEPELVECPDDSEECFKYCNDVKCVIINDFWDLLEDHNLKTGEVLSYTYIYDDFEPEIFALQCGSQTVTPFDYCDNDLVTIEWPCAFHVNVTSNMTEDKYYEEYRMMYGSHTAYSFEYYLEDGEFYYGLVYFDVLSYPVTYEVATNWTGSCEIEDPQEFGDLYETYDTSFTYYGEEEKVDCPDGSPNCSQYCDRIKCIILDKDNRLVEDINLETSEALIYTYFDDVPTVDMFKSDCAGTKHDAIDFCNERITPIYWDCAFHMNVTTNTSEFGEYHEEYRMMSGKKTAYAIHNVHTKHEDYYELAIFMTEYDFPVYTLLTNRSGECEEMWAVGADEIYETAFVYYHDPQKVPCPRGSGECTKYCSLIKCLILDSKNRLLRQIDLLNDFEIDYELLGDIPSYKMFELECAGTKYNATNYCPTPPSSSSSHATAALAVVVACLFAVLL